MNPSKMRPIVGIPACIKQVGAHPYHAVGVRYVEAVLRAADCTPILLPAIGSEQDIEQLLGLVDGLLFTGSSSNVAPELYGQKVLHETSPRDDHRDATTIPLIKAALENGVPVFSICRGFQELNVALGGTLFQAVHEQPGKLDHREPPDQPLDIQFGPAHKVQLTQGGELQRLLGGAETIQVNSIHGQGVDRLADGLVAEAFAPDGLVEAVRVREAQTFAMAFQWHPEWKVAEHPESIALFSAFGAACRTRQAHKFSSFTERK
jgi:putative glutamine amidotransferase